MTTSTSPSDSGTVTTLVEPHPYRRTQTPDNCYINTPAPPSSPIDSRHPPPRAAPTALEHAHAQIALLRSQLNASESQNSTMKEQLRLIRIKYNQLHQERLARDQAHFATTSNLNKASNKLQEASAAADYFSQQLQDSCNLHTTALRIVERAAARGVARQAQVDGLSRELNELGKEHTCVLIAFDDFMEAVNERVGESGELV